MDFNIKNIKVIIGLGNPGIKYYRNRHSIGFRILDKIAQNYSVNWHILDIAEETKISITVDENIYSIILIKPQTFMNASGNVIPNLQKKGIKPENILVVHDELEKSFGNISLKFDGSARGHNGLKSIINGVGSAFWRLRFGVGRPENDDVSTYVLSNFSNDEEIKIQTLIDEAITKIFGV
ncbi:aminoacyl-tRNA hydrolase [Candidatus Dependentiae bacterium]|nr:aminoacyl-tRNA hydrolase [Candidatus Dependentiae bacterium]MBU4387256.1 aminoacyl-tRNA hydrolase [Candidatus Dependentiae bacterium]MCG2756541.1 aminoacyl-tRNA hydrolase [Candidatus Dependentiae bacterium]